ncbi:14917_t:CDS:10 [Funneliformis geosporum]|uniref:6325_t:CDS:1 n=1 Tax=Funneliformis geosporum TaxID=1117311 RepID=A0A9W4SJU0_9GLOM|nr:14917_t:CDS:10 [Funneliformis geosporum]CAI2171046.1 6325_t:CDS:10 [Funneliformis geosporum]
MAASCRKLAIKDSSVNYEENTMRSKKLIEYRSLPDEIPPNLCPVDIIGEKRFHLQRIEKSTNTDMFYNKDDSKIELWGIRKDLDQALKQLHVLAENILAKDQRERNKSRVNGWVNLEKALNDKQKHKFDRGSAREREERDYRGFPPEQKLFNGHFVLPSFEIPIARIIGEKEEILHPIRADTKCYMWYEPSSNLIRIVGDTYESVEEATMRVKNLYIKVVTSRQIPRVIKDGATIYNGWIYHLVEPPHEPCEIRIANPPSWFYFPYDVNGVVKLIEPVYKGESISVVGKEGALKKLNPNSYFDALQSIRESNVRTIKSALSKAFITIHLLDEITKMRVRFGYVCLTDFPREPLWSIDKFNKKILYDSRLRSKFAKCIATEHKKLDPLFEILSEYDQQWDGSPFREFKICTIHKIQKGRDQETLPFYSNTEEINVVSICEKTRWKYWWGTNYIIEVTKYEFWKLSKYMDDLPGVEIPLDQEPPFSVTFGVSFYKKSWEEDFAFNGSLNVGEAPEWHPYDIMDEEQTGGVNDFMNEIRNFLEVLLLIPTERNNHSY